MGRFSCRVFYNAQWGFVSVHNAYPHSVSTGTKTLKIGTYTYLRVYRKYQNPLVRILLTIYKM